MRAFRHGAPRTSSAGARRASTTRVVSVPALAQVAAAGVEAAGMEAAAAVLTVTVRVPLRRAGLGRVRRRGSGEGGHSGGEDAEDDAVHDVPPFAGETTASGALFVSATI